MRTFVVSAVVVSAFAVSACNGLPFFTGDCAGVGYYALQIQIIGPDGLPAALGSVVTVTDGDYRTVDSVVHNPLMVLAGSDRAGHTYDVRVEKPNYNTFTTRVNAKGGDDNCVTSSEVRENTTSVDVHLTLAPDARPIRAFHVLPKNILLDRSPGLASFSFTPYFETAPNVSRALTWSITGDTASVTLDRATGALTYKCRSVSGYLTITARMVTDPTISASSEIAVQGHPAAPNDPPCS